MKENGYMTIYLALTLGVMISLCLALIEGCRYRGICLETECVMDIGMDSILAEYHRELFDQYNFFAVDCSYGTEHGTTKLTEEHLLEYMNHNFSLEDIFLDKFLYRDFFALEAEKAEMTKAAFVTDGDGEVFRRMAVDAIEDDVGIGLLQQIKEWVKTIKSRGLLERSVEEEKQTVDAQIREYDGRETADGKVIHIENPTEALEEKKKSGILSLVLPEEEISDRRIETEPDRHIFSSQTHEHMTISCVEEIYKKYIKLAKEKTPNLFKEEHYSPHSMRHTTGQHMLEAGVPIMVIKAFLGHASVQTTQIYTESPQATVDKHIREWNEMNFPRSIYIDEKDLEERNVPDFLKSH